MGNEADYAYFTTCIYVIEYVNGKHYLQNDVFSGFTWIHLLDAAFRKKISKMVYCTKNEYDVHVALGVMPPYSDLGIGGEFVGAYIENGWKPYNKG